MSAKILSILLQNKAIDESQAGQAKVQASRTGRTIESVILELGFTNDFEIAKAKAEEFKIPFVDLSEVQISNEVTGLISADLLQAHKSVPYEDVPQGVKIAMVDPFDIPAIQALQQSVSNGKKLIIHIASPTQIQQVLDRRLGQAISSEVSEALEEVEQPITEITEAVEDITVAEATLQTAPVARIVNSILQYAAKSDSSDVHIEPLETSIRVRYRIHGVMTEKLKLPKSVHSSVVARIKIMAKLKIDEKRVPQDGRIPLKIGVRRIDLRVSTLPTVFGEKVVMRLLERTKGVQPLEVSGLRGSAYKTYLEGIQATTGIILATGPTGCGKSTTLAGTISKLNKPEVNIITLEDPVEIRIAGVNQVQINPDAGLTFASGLRSILRQDPDIIMVGEVRDSETAALAVQAALTGHLVLSTLHTNSAAAALPRLLDMQVEPYLLASVLHVVLAQRLPRKICSHCKESHVVEQAVIDDINNVLGNIRDFDVAKYLLSRCKNQGEDTSEGTKMTCPTERGDGQYDIYLYKGKGCDHCGGTGYSGRIGIFEVLRVSDNIGRMIIENKSDTEIEQQAMREGMIKMIQDGYLKALEGATTLEEVLRVCKE